MTLRELLSHVRRKIRGRSEPPLHLESLDRYQLDPGSADALASAAAGDLARIFFGHRGRVAHKWVHYLDIYERHFAPFRNTPVRMLEIGVFKGGSLQIWREYFGSNAIIFGIDIDPRCVDYVDQPNQVRIGSQADQSFLKSVISEMGNPDIILDDGSHIGRHQRASFNALFPTLKYGGLYVIEDLHTAYWPELHEGGYRRPETAVEFIKEMIDDMHAWYHRHSTTTPGKDDIGAIHIYDSIVVIEKSQRRPPGHIQIS
jgi:Methyltransferase domain